MFLYLVICTDPDGDEKGIYAAAEDFNGAEKKASNLLKKLNFVDFIVIEITLIAADIDGVTNYLLAT